MDQAADIRREFAAFSNRVELVAVIDHAGRAGNNFFLSIFDQHPQVLTCPWVHYAYSYVVTEYRGARTLDAPAAHRFWTERWYFRYLYQDPTPELIRQIRKFGGNPEVLLDRTVVRQVFDALLSAGGRIARRELVLASYFSYARAVGRDVSAIKYVLVSDSISLRTEDVLDGFSGSVVDHILDDFPTARLIHLERDPRAGFASSRHQFVNSMGNMYGIRPGNYWRLLCRAATLRYDTESPFVFGYWLLYFAQTYRAVERKKQERAAHFRVVRNEDVNLRFRCTVDEVADWLRVRPLPEWRAEPYVPTMLGAAWAGMGAYNSAYQPNRYGPLANDPDEVAAHVTGPNSYVTQRWRTRLWRNEILILEWALGREIQAHGYEFLTGREHRTLPRFISALLQPLSGELPTFRWVALGRRLGRRELMSRVFFACTFPPFYVLSRLSLLRAVASRRVLPA